MSRGVKWAIAGVVALLVAAGVAGLVIARTGEDDDSGARGHRLATPKVARLYGKRAVLSRGTSLVAAAGRKKVPIYAHSYSHRPKLRLRNPNPQGAERVFLVRVAKPGRLLVSLPVRPNGSTGWVRRRDVTLSRTPYFLRVDLTRHRLDLRKRGRRVAQYPIGVGQAVTPTPSGTYYITELFEQPYAGSPYGPYAFGLSGHSNVLHEFEGGPGQIGIHGTNYPQGIGTDVSHGCIRMSNEDITHLARILPLGTPVKIVR
jgi:lipoprotein-anchoring transpeptidase ErfK/SrfK